MPKGTGRPANRPTRKAISDFKAAKDSWRASKDVDTSMARAKTALNAKRNVIETRRATKVSAAKASSDRKKASLARNKTK